MRVSVHASPDGPLPKNRELSLRRAISLRNYLIENFKVPDSIMSFCGSTVPWDKLRGIIVASDYKWRDGALSIMDSGSDSSAVDNAVRMNRLKSLAGGEAWSVMRSDILPRLRCAHVVTTIRNVRQPEPGDAPAAIPDTISEPVKQPVTETIEWQADTAICNLPQEPATATPVIKIGTSRRCYGIYAIKTNAAYLAAGVTNIGGEMAVSDHWSIDLPIVYSLYTISISYRLRFLYIQPEARYWLDRPLRGHFFGAHIHLGVANVSLDNDNRYQTPDGFYGAGISYGYSLPIAKRWSIELTIGAGYFHTKYDTYYNIGVHKGKRYEKDHPLNYWGMDKAGINIVYRFGDRSGNRKETGRL